MANQKHLVILKQGVVVWNEWCDRPQEAGIDFEKVDLRDADLSDTNLCNVNFIWADLRGVNLHTARLSDADLSDADLSDADLSDANLSRANLSRANLSRANLNRTNFSDADLSRANLNRANLSRANLSDADLSKTNFDKAELWEADLSRANLGGTDLSRADLGGANLIRADLRQARLSETYLNGANLSRAKLNGAYLTGTYLIGADLSGADLNGIHLSRVDLGGAHLRGADLSRANVIATVFGNLDLRSVKGLETINHEGPSTIGIDTLERSRGQIPEQFLRGAGVSEIFIGHARALAAEPLDFSVCFISCAREDQSFAEKLCATMRVEGVRCWFTPDELHWGGRSQPSIEANSLYDKLIMVLSKHSVLHPWVQQEVEVTLARERNEHRVVLFPLLLDNSVLEVEQSWLAPILNARTVGDFTQWEQLDAYQKALNRLLQDLKMEASKPEA